MEGLHVTLDMPDSPGHEAASAVGEKIRERLSIEMKGMDLPVKSTEADKNSLINVESSKNFRAGLAVQSYSYFR